MQRVRVENGTEFLLSLTSRPKPKRYFHSLATGRGYGRLKAPNGVI